MRSFKLNKTVYFYGLVISLFGFMKVHAGPIVIRNSSVYILNKDSWSYFQTPDKTTPLPEILKAYGEGQFKTVGQAVFNGGIASQYYWFHFTISNQDVVDNNLLVDIENPRIHELELFELVGGQLVSLGKTGNFAAFSQRPTVHKNFVYNSVLKKDQTREYYLYVNQVGHTLILPIKIFKSKVFPTITFRNYLSDGITYGILLFVGY